MSDTIYKVVDECATFVDQKFNTSHDASKTRYKKWVIFKCF